MNFLAHLYLSGSQPELLVGNFIADHVKGNQIMLFGPGVKDGITLHRSIDAFTDGHPVVRESVIRLRPGFRKYAGVIVDMFYDHFLARYWAEYSETTLEDFTAGCYSILQQHTGPLPERSRRMLYYMERDNWLLAYREPEGLETAFRGMAYRTSFYSGMENAVVALLENYESYSKEFGLFFPELVEYAEKVRTDINNKNGGV
jgi:acyl carrier protein phosphodiesterase